jgi:hypothetical protein
MSRVGLAFDGLTHQNGEDVTVATGTSAAITSVATYRSAVQGILVQALSTNTVSLFVGASGVTVLTGIELEAGKSIMLPITDPTKVYAISGSAAQSLRFMVL